MIFLISFCGARMLSLAPCPLLPVLWSEQQCSGANWFSALEIECSTSRYGFAAGNLKREVISSIFALSLYPCNKCHGVIIDCYQSSYDARSSRACIEINWIENVSTFRGRICLCESWILALLKGYRWQLGEAAFRSFLDHWWVDLFRISGEKQHMRMIRARASTHWRFILMR